jgi:uncharacterized membrane protein YeaQ/YmgE (transglycosylase-associated protein family)
MKGNQGKTMSAKAIIIWLIVGAVAGWLAGMVVKGGGYGLIGNIIVGIVGGLIAGWLLPHIGGPWPTTCLAAIASIQDSRWKRFRKSSTPCVLTQR